jgi:hypothetical protein
MATTQTGRLGPPATIACASKEAPPAPCAKRDRDARRTATMAAAKKDKRSTISTPASRCCVALTCSWTKPPFLKRGGRPGQSSLRGPFACDRPFGPRGGTRARRRRGMVLDPGGCAPVSVTAIAMQTAKLVTAGWLASRRRATARMWRLVLVTLAAGPDPPASAARHCARECAREC